MKRRTKLISAAIAAPVLIVGGAVTAFAAGGTGCATLTYPLCARSVAKAQVVDHSLDETEFTAGVNAKLNKTAQTGPAGPQGPAGPAGATGPVGPQGPKGDSAIVSVVAVSSLIDRPDSGLNGDWAKDNLTRTVAITRQAAVKASNCGGAATKCWLYTGSIADNGSFTTIPDAKSPQAGVTIAGTVSGTAAGASQIEFYASSDAPDPSKVDATVTGAAHPTSEWVKMFFPAGTVVTPTELLDWQWTYNAPATCEKWVNGIKGNTGDITGVNAC